MKSISREEGNEGIDETPESKCFEPILTFSLGYQRHLMGSLIKLLTILIHFDLFANQLANITCIHIVAEAGISITLFAQLFLELYFDTRLCVIRKTK